MFRPLLFLLAFVACTRISPPPPTAPDPEQVRAEITRVLDDFHAAATAADEGRYFDHLADDAIFLGTDATERWDKPAFRAYAHPHFAKGKAWSFHSQRRGVSLDPGGNLAWFDEDLSSQNLGPLRGSGVVALRAGRWKIVQYNLTLTIPNARFALVKEVAGSATLRGVAKHEPLRELAWLSGAWVAKKPNGELVEEHWTSADGGSLIGSGRTLKHEKTIFFEHLRIQARDKKVVYVAQPLGRPATEFERTSSKLGEVVFENPKHDWPKRILYRRTTGGVSVRVSGGVNQRVEEWTMAPAMIERQKVE